MKEMRVLFIGQSLPLSLAVLNSIQKQHNVVFIIEFIGKAKNNSSLEEVAKKYNIEYLSIEKNQCQSILKEKIQYKYIDVSFICSMPCLLSQDLISIPKYGTINTHPSLLPNYRGPNPKFWIYHNFEKKGGVTIHYVDKGEDTGNIIIQKEFSIPTGYSSKSYDMSIINAAKNMANVALKKVSQGDKGSPQLVSSEHIRARRLKKDETFDYCVSWDIKKLYHFISGTGILPKKMTLPKFIRILFNVKVFKLETENIVRNKTGVFFLWRRGIYYQHERGKIFFKLRIKGFNRLLKQ